MSDETRERKPEAGGARRPYEPPAVAWEEDFQPYVFSTCGKQPSQGGACIGNRKS